MRNAHPPGARYEHSLRTRRARRWLVGRGRQATPGLRRRSGRTVPAYAAFRPVGTVDRPARRHPSSRSSATTTASPSPTRSSPPSATASPPASPTRPASCMFVVAAGRRLSGARPSHRVRLRRAVARRPRHARRRHDVVVRAEAQPAAFLEPIHDDPRQVYDAGVRGRRAGAASAPSTASGDGDDDHGEVAWRIRHLKRSVLKDATEQVHRVAARRSTTATSIRSPRTRSIAGATSTP